VASAEVLRRAEARTLLARAFVASLAIIAVIGVLERMLGAPFEKVLDLFHGEPTWLLGEKRLSTVFWHANTCAAYFELVAPFALVGFAFASHRSARIAHGLLLACVAVLLSLTYSRAGLGAAAFTSTLIAIASLRARRHRMLGVASIVYALVAVTSFFANPHMRARIGLRAGHMYGVTFTMPDTCAYHLGDSPRRRVVVRNVGDIPLADSQAPGAITFVWFDGESGEPVKIDPVYTPFDHIDPGERKTVEAELVLPVAPGTYILLFDVAREGVLWLSDIGNPPATEPCAIVAAGEPLPEGPVHHAGFSQRFGLDAAQKLRPRYRELERAQYWNAAWELFRRHPWLGIGPDRFRVEYRHWVSSDAWDPRARTHSILAETAVDTGLAGLVVLLALGGLVLSQGRRAWRRFAHSPSREAALGVAIACGLAGFALHSMVDQFLTYTQIYVIFWPAVGLSAALASREETT